MKQNQEQPEFRIKIPRNNEILGFIEQRLGGSRMRVRCLDGKTRICRVPGRLKRKLWIREGDLLLIEHWEFDNEKGDVVFKYQKNHIDWLKRKGYLKSLESIEEF